MLDLTLTTAFVAATNLKDQMSGGNWTFLLPSLELEQIMCPGMPATTCSTAQIVEVTARYCERTGLSSDLIEPLFYTCWRHRALKEATRLPLDRLEKGHYVRLLRLCIERRSAPVLRRLFALPADADHTHPLR